MKILPVNRSFYQFSIFFTGLLSVFTLCESLAQFQLGPKLFSLSSYVPWFLLGAGISLICSLFLLIYYHHKKYFITFYAAVFDLAVLLWYSIVVYDVLMGGAILRNFYLPSLLATFLSGITYAGSLVFSASGVRPWLKTTGIMLLLIKLSLTITTFWAYSTPNVKTMETAEVISHWILLASCFLFIPITTNFRDELKALKEEHKEARQVRLENLLGIFSGLLLIGLIGLGAWLHTEKYWLVKWSERGPERALQLAEPFEARLFINDQGDTLKYRLLQPLDYDTTKKYPLVLSLHGGGGRGMDNVIQIEGSRMAQLLSTQSNRAKYPAFVFVPQCPPLSSWGGISDWPVVDSIVFDAMLELEKEFNIDEKRRYVMGESLGGYGTWHFICMYPNLFAAAVPVSGGGDPILAQSIYNLPVWAFHGANDRSVPVRNSRDMIQGMKDAGGNPKYTEFSEEGHLIGDQVVATPGLLDWVFDQKRE